jgi:hypothetical protein
MHKSVYIVSSLINIAVLAIIYNYINTVDTDCKCENVDNKLTQYFNMYVYIMVFIQLMNIIYSFTGYRSEIISIFSLVLYAFHLITYVLLLKYIYTLNTKCQCDTVDPTKRNFLQIYAWAIVIFNGLGLLTLGYKHVQRRSQPRIIIVSAPSVSSEPVKRAKRTLKIKGRKLKRSKK